MKQPLHIRVAFTVAAISLLIAAVTSLVSYRYTYANTLESARSTLYHLARTVERTAEIAVYLDNAEIAGDAIYGLSRSELVAGVSLTSVSGLKSSFGKIPQKPEQSEAVRLVLDSPFSPGLKSGEILIFPDREVIGRAARTSALRTALLLAAFVGVVALVITRVVHIMFIRPLRQVATSLGRVLPGETLSIDTPANHHGDEIGQLVEYVNHQLVLVKETLDTVRKQFRFLQVLIDTIPSPIFVKDIDCRYRECNIAFQEFVQIKQEDLMGRTVHELWPAKLAQEYHRMDVELLADGGVQTYEASARSSDGTERDVIFHKAVFRDHTGSPAGIVGVILDITERRNQERALREAQSDLMYASRLAGMAETATIVLHNVGNVLNSVNISAGIINQRIEGSKAGGLGKAVRMIQEHGEDLPGYLSSDAKGKLLPGYLAKLAEALEGEQQEIGREIDVLMKSVEHIKEIVATQRSFTGASSLIERVQVDELVGDSLRMTDFMADGRVTIVEEIEEGLEFSLDRTRVLQILVNLIGNAKQAVAAVPGREGRITISAGLEGETLHISVADNGIGIPAENMTRIFNHGFTTRKDGHGFGLHSSALAAKDMGGSLEVFSAGPGAGATFILNLPVKAAL